MENIAANLLGPVVGFLLSVLKLVGFAVLVVVVLFLVRFFLAFRCIPFLRSADHLRALTIKSKIFDLLRWVLVDFKERGLHVGEFRESGFTFFVGRQGSGKTTAMVEWLNNMHFLYPNCLIVTNFKYKYANFIMMDWQDLLEVRNGKAGVIFALDEIHSEYSAAAWKDVPENLLSEISQQRKQRVKIVGTTQFFTRVAKPLREQANTVVSCSCMFGRFIRTRTYDALEYSTFVDNPIIVKKSLKPLSKRSFVASDFIRGCFDTYEKINRMRKIEESNRRVGKK